MFGWRLRLRYDTESMLSQSYRNWTLRWRCLSKWIHMLSGWCRSKFAMLPDLYWYWNCGWPTAEWQPLPCGYKAYLWRMLSNCKISNACTYIFPFGKPPRLITR
uniref:Uncharacterized protein n=1 Tax=Ascaris lumbricoides TaxID=6252 RepID=A0A0M3HMP3_ASCLU